MNLEEMKKDILERIREYSAAAHEGCRPQGRDIKPKKFVAGTDSVPYAGRVFDQEEVVAASAALLDFWLTMGAEGQAFEEEFAEFLGVRGTVLTNSGSSANLLAASALTSFRLGEKRLKRGDEVITVAAGFPTTVAPLIQNGLCPVFIDNDTKTLNARIEMLEEAYRPGKTKAVFMAHTLGNPFDLSAVTAFCKKHALLLVEDNCDALGSRYDGQLTGTFGDMATQSFYPPHHITLGEGGAISYARDVKFRSILESFRDWGRDCWCASGKDNTCQKRFKWKIGDMPAGYDHKFIYSHIGYNLKPLDLQAAIGRNQLKKVNSFIESRKANWEHLRRGLKNLDEHFEFQLPAHANNWTEKGFEWDASGHKSDPSWFGFMIRVKETAPFTKFELARHLDAKKIGNRMLFGGNLVKQPGFQRLKDEYPDAFRVVGNLTGADTIMTEAIFIGVYPGLSTPMLDYMIEVIQDFVRSK